MNFVLHFHLAARDLGSPIAGVGAMLPDLWRMADRRVRARRELADVHAHLDTDDGNVTALLDGVRHHLEADRWFHASPTFVEGERRAAGLLREAALTAPRAGLLAHILWELCLDGALLRRDGLEPTLVDLREGLTRTSSEALAAAVDRHHFAHPASEARAPYVRASFDLRVARILSEVARGPWIDGYQTGVGVAERLQGVRRAVGLAPMDPRDLDRLASVAEALIAAAHHELVRLEATHGGAIPRSAPSTQVPEQT